MSFLSGDDLLNRAATIVADSVGSGPADLVGHSLGGVVAARAASVLGERHVRRAVLIASPYGLRRRRTSPMLRARRRGDGSVAEPDIREQFYGPHTPETIQTQTWSMAADEADDILRLAFEPVWFHTDQIATPLNQPSLVILSEADEVVSGAEAASFADAIGAQVLRFSADRQIGHNDLIQSPKIAPEVARAVEAFLSS